MTINAQLFDDKYVTVDDRTAGLGGSFYYQPLRSYSPAPLKWAYEQLARYPEAVLLDGGSSTGCYSLLAVHHPGLTVYAFEPVRLTCQVLRANIALNDIGNRVKTFGIGVSDHNGYDILHSIRDIGGSGVSMVGGIPAWHKDCIDSPVKVTTLDRFCNRHKIAPHLIKLDLEGGERAALLGAAETIQRYKPFLIVEYSNENANQYGYNSSELIVMLEAWGYVFTIPEGTDILAVHREWETKTGV